MAWVVNQLVKGVHQNIIEITDTGSDCFERAILFVRQDKAGQDPSHLLSRARIYLQNLKLRRGLLRRGSLWPGILKLAVAAVAGAATAVFFLSVYTL